MIIEIEEDELRKFISKYIGELQKLSGADYIERGSTTGSYALGYTDDDGEIWYGGASMSSYINELSAVDLTEEERAQLGVNLNDTVYQWVQWTDAK